MKDPGRLTFAVTIRPGRGGGAMIEVPFSVEEVYGTRGRVPVKASFDGHPYRGSIAPMGGTHLLGIRKDIRTALGKDVGDSVEVVLDLDTEPRTVDVPPELVAALDGDGEAAEIFQGLSYTRRKEFARWVDEAKKQETRDRRAAKALDHLRDGRAP